MYLSPSHADTSAATPVSASWDVTAGRSLHEFELSSHEAVFCEGDEAKSLYEVVEGVLCNYQILLDGRRQIISFAYPGDLIGLGHDAAYRFNCDAVCEARIRSIPKGALMHDAKGCPEIGHRLLQVANSELAQMQEHQRMLGRRSAIEKVASFLLVLARKRTGDDARETHFQLPMTRMDIADFLGITIETVSRNLSKLRIMGVIRMPHTKTVEVLDVERLQELADGEEGIS